MQCDILDEALASKLESVGGSNYSAVTQLTYRQVGGLAVSRPPASLISNPFHVSQVFGANGFAWNGSALWMYQKVIFVLCGRLPYLSTVRLSSYLCAGDFIRWRHVDSGCFVSKRRTALILRKWRVFAGPPRTSGILSGPGDVHVYKITFIHALTDNLLGVLCASCSLQLFFMSGFFPGHPFTQPCSIHSCGKWPVVDAGESGDC